MKLIGTSASGEKREIKPLSFEIRADCDTPADCFEGKFLFERRLGEIRSIEAYSGEKLVFRGDADETEIKADESGVYIRIYARSVCAPLLDNEAVPALYSYPSAQDIAAMHALPFGIKAEIGENLRYHGDFSVSKGESHRQVIAKFCRSVYGCEPSVSPEGILRFSGRYSEPEILFSDCSGGITCSEYSFTQMHTGAVEKIICRVQREGGYTHTLTNPYLPSGEKGLTRALDLTNIPLWERQNKTDSAFRRSLKNRTEIRLLISGEHGLEIGRCAAFYCRPLGMTEGLYISKYTYRENSKGAFTALTLRKREE